jgi:hypothetical protein
VASGLCNVVDHGNGLNGRVVVQTQDHQVRLRHQGTFGINILAQLRRYAEQFNARHALQAIADLQTRGAGFAVDKYFLHVQALLVSFSSDAHWIIMNYSSSTHVVFFGALQHDTVPG